jgi:hypothetical protein
MGTESRAPIASKVRPGGGTVFVPTRYRIEGQWALIRKRKVARSDWTLDATALSEEQETVGG